MRWRGEVAGRGTWYEVAEGSGAAEVIFGFPVFMFNFGRNFGRFFACFPWGYDPSFRAPTVNGRNKKGIFLRFSLEFPRGSYGFLKGFPLFSLHTPRAK